MRRLIGLAFAAALLWGCTAREDLPPGGPVGHATKTVVCKVEPSTLVAVDGTVCNVRPGKFETAQVGDGVWCEWRRGAGCPGSNGG